VAHLRMRGARDSVALFKKGPFGTKLGTVRSGPVIATSLGRQRMPIVSAFIGAKI